MANSLMSMFGKVASEPKAMEIAKQAFWSFVRGESPADFLQQLGQREPDVKGLDLTDINATAQKLCRERGIDPQKLTQEVKQFMQNMK